MEYQMRKKQRDYVLGFFRETEPIGERERQRERRREKESALL